MGEDCEGLEGLLPSPDAGMGSPNDMGHEGFGGYDCVGPDQEHISEERQLVLAQVQAALEEHEPINLESAAQALGMPFPSLKKRVRPPCFLICCIPGAFTTPEDFKLLKILQLCMINPAYTILCFGTFKS